MTIKPIVNFLKVKRQDKRQRTMNEQLFDRVRQLFLSLNDNNIWWARSITIAVHGSRVGWNRKTGISERTSLSPRQVGLSDAPIERRRRSCCCCLDMKWWIWNISSRYWWENHHRQQIRWSSKHTRSGAWKTPCITWSLSEALHQDPVTMPAGRIG